MSTPTPTGQRRPGHAEARVLAPIRWPHLNAQAMALVGLWALGVFVALGLPAMIVSPTAKNPPTLDVWLAFGSTILGASIMMSAAALLWRRARDAGVFVLGMVPAVVCIAGGAMLAAAKIGAS